MYLPYDDTGFAEDQVHVYDRNADQMPYPASAFYHSTPAYEPMQPQFYDPRKAPEVTSYSPQQGPPGTRIFIQIHAAYDFGSESPLSLNLMFGGQTVESELTSLGHRDSTYQYALIAHAPIFSLTNNTQVPLRIRVHDGSAYVNDIDAGYFRYIDGLDHQSQMSPQDQSRKRKISENVADMTKMPAKRSSKQQLHSARAESYDLNPYTQSEPFSFSQATQTAPVNSPYDSMISYGRSPSQRNFQENATIKGSPQSYYPASRPHSLLKAPSPQIWSANQASRSSGLTATPASRISSISSPPVQANPPLIRTSTLQQSPSPAIPQAGSGGGSFNPYAIYPHKAVLKINGDLDSMADRWTPNEWSLKRRIVQFWRSQSGSTINTNFEPVAPEDRPPSSICISCILWEERQECFVTSVDTIFLLESLVAVRFTVEEKNRIRRNLEGFRPMTVSKAKSDSEEFFKVIMGFPNPKPRNIEKDVKVFPWKILAHALKKIIGKYVSQG